MQDLLFQTEALSQTFQYITKMQIILERLSLTFFWWEDQAFKHEAIARCYYSMVVQHRRRLLVLMCRFASAHSSYTSNEYMYVFVLLTTYILSST